jgi:hypothetical protein
MTLVSVDPAVGDAVGLAVAVCDSGTLIGARTPEQIRTVRSSDDPPARGDRREATPLEDKQRGDKLAAASGADSARRSLRAIGGGTARDGRCR